MTPTLDYADMTADQRRREHLRWWKTQPTAKRLAALELGVYDLHDCEENNCKFHERTVARLRFIIRVVASLLDADKQAALMAVLKEWDGVDFDDLSLNEFPIFKETGLDLPADPWFDQSDQNAANASSPPANNATAP